MTRGLVLLRLFCRSPDISLQALIIFVFLALKIGLLVKYGPIEQPDTNGYLFIADRISEGWSAFLTVPDWSTNPVAPLAFRTFGYPLVVVIARLLCGGAYAYLIVIVQMALSLYAGSLLFRLACRLSKSMTLASLVMAFYFCGQTMLWDQCILSDSLYSSLFNIVLLSLVVLYLEKKPLKSHWLVVLSLVWAYSIFTRDSGIYFTILPVGILYVQARENAGGAARKWSGIAAFLVPLALAGTLYVGWNAYRTGEAFFSITGVANFMRPSFDLARTGEVKPFEGTDKFSSILRANVHDFSFAEQLGILQTLHDELALKSPTQLMSLAERQYIKTIVEHPLPYARFIIGNMDPRALAGLVFDPFDSYNAYFQLGVPPYLRVVPAITPKELSGLARRGDFEHLLLGITAFLAKALSMLVLMGGYGIALWAVWRGGTQDSMRREARTILILATASLLVTGFFALVHSEDRLKLPAVPAVLIVCAYGLSLLSVRWRNYTDAMVPTSAEGPDGTAL